MAGRSLLAARWALTGLTIAPALAQETAEGPGELSALLSAHCGACHGGTRPKAGLDLTALDVADLATAADALAQVRAAQMPPATVAPLPDDDRFAIVRGLSALLAAAPPDPGRPTLRRLSRVEYGRTVRDLLGIEVDVERELPEDATSAGFDNQGDVLFMTPESAEIYARATDRAVDALLADGGALARLGLAGLPGSTAGLEAFLRRAFRRPATPIEVAARVELARHGPRAVLSSVLLSPHFLYRIEEDRDSEEPWRVSDYELATRLSYFLWASAPDEALLDRAAAGELSEARVLASELERMLEDDRARAFATRFGTRWLGVADVPTQAVDVRRFSGTHVELKHAMVQETALFLDELVREDASLLSLIDADFTYVNQALAKHYGLEAVQGAQLRRVELSDRRRGGVLTQASVLTATSQPLRTSPVVRGAWVLERLLGAPPAPPPPDAGALPPDDQLEDGLDLRQRLARHRADPSCASCHARIDPIGFALENFDGVGRWRDEDHVGPIDARATLPDGRELAGIEGLKDALLARPEPIARAVTEALLVYALGRALEPVDAPIVDGIVARLAERGWGMRSLVVEVALSYPFQHRRRAR